VAPTADETKRQIEGLRAEVTDILNELEARGRRVVSFPWAVRSQVAGGARRNAERNPLALAMLGAALLLALVALAMRARRRARERRRATEVLRRRARTAASDLGDYLGRARGKLPLSVQLGSADGARTEATAKEDPNMIKKMLWMGLSSGVLALAGLAARRVSAAIWQGTMKEHPPSAKV
jgi:hypothetical protein